MQESQKVINLAINSNITVSVKGQNSEIDLEAPLWAINWFNFKHAWLYNLYLKLAIPIVEKIGASLFFKGKLNRVLEGKEKDEREMLVIVNYPGIGSFLNLLKKRMFQLLSVIRTKSLKNFVFGFTDNLLRFTDKNNPSLWIENRQVGYLVHHFQCENNNNERMIQLVNDIAIDGVNCFFCGIKAAEIGRQIRGSDTRYIKLFDGLILFEASSPEAMQRILHHDSHKKFKKDNQNNFMAIYNRQA